jgi:hypothetical protein
MVKRIKTRRHKKARSSKMMKNTLGLLNNGVSLISNTLDKSRKFLMKKSKARRTYNSRTRKLRR